MTAPYRSDFDALSARHAALSEELAAVRARTRELTELQQQEATLTGELATLQKKLDGMPSRRSLPILESIRIASPCTASWDEMTGDERVRFCGHCAKDVYNLSGMTREESEQLLRERAGNICVRLYKRHDGTVLTADCPVGVTRKRRRRIIATAVGSGLAAAGALFYQDATPPHDTVMGSIAAADISLVATDIRMGEVAPLPDAPAPPPEVAPPPTSTAKATHPAPLMGRAVIHRDPAVKRPPSSR